jgi:hypothetical protein
LRENSYARLTSSDWRVRATLEVDLGGQTVEKASPVREKVEESTPDTLTPTAAVV